MQKNTIFDLIKINDFAFVWLCFAHSNRFSACAVVAVALAIAASNRWQFFAVAPLVIRSSRQFSFIVFRTVRQFISGCCCRCCCCFVLSIKLFRGNLHHIKYSLVDALQWTHNELHFSVRSMAKCFEHWLNGFVCTPSTKSRKDRERERETKRKQWQSHGRRYTTMQSRTRSDVIFMFVVLIALGRLLLRFIFRMDTQRRPLIIFVSVVLFFVDVIVSFRTFCEQFSVLDHCVSDHSPVVRGKWNASVTQTHIEATAFIRKCTTIRYLSADAFEKWASDHETKPN